MLGVRSDAADGYDDFDAMDTAPDIGYAAVWHEEGVHGWDGPTGFYRLDFRAFPEPDESKTWAPIHLWADPDYYGSETMAISFLGDATSPPPANRVYTLELLYVPPVGPGAPDVGTKWDVPPDRPFFLEVPTFKTYNGLEGYQFSFTARAVPEPAGALPLLALMLLRRRN